MEALSTIIIMLAIGAVAGWLAGNIVSGGGFGLIGNIVVGIVGAVVASLIGNVVTVGIPGLSGLPEWAITLIWSTIGAIIALLVIKFIKRA